MLKKALKGIGLNSGEIDVYLNCLKLGTQDLRTLEAETGLPPAEIMLILSDLMERGFVSKFSKGKDFFTPEQPRVLLNVLENKKVKLEKDIKAFEKVIPQFEDFMNPSFAKPEMSFFKGRDGIIAAYEDTLTSKTDILAIVDVSDTEELFPTYVPKYYKRRKTAGIFIKAIFPDCEIARKRQAKDKEELRESRLVPRDLLEFHIELNIYDDKVAYFSVREELAVIIKSKMIAESMRNMFQMCWSMAEGYDKKNK